ICISLTCDKGGFYCRPFGRHVQRRTGLNDLDAVAADVSWVTAAAECLSSQPQLSEPCSQLMACGRSAGTATATAGRSVAPETWTAGPKQAPFDEPLWKGRYLPNMTHPAALHRRRCPRHGLATKTAGPDTGLAELPSLT